MKDPIQQIFKLGFPWQTQDPFLFCVHHLDHFPKGKEDMSPDASLAGRMLGNDFTIKDGWRMYHGHTIPGFPAHPHKGFETVTIVNQGFCDHSDSLGAAGRFGQGDVQWMTAGRGVQHSEMFPLLKQDGENTLELFQIWLNLPASKKQVDPHFKMLWHEDIPVLRSGKATIKIIAGAFESTPSPSPPPDSWAADSGNGVAIWQIDVDADSEWDLPTASSAVNRSLFLYAGKGVQVGARAVDSESGMLLDPEIATTLRTGAERAKFLLLQGRPIAESVVQRGPFVMNSAEEIQKAMQEYRLTQFGGWPWPHPDHVHSREKGRFALYPDGKLVEK